jgi:hypothetical protein
MLAVSPISPKLQTVFWIAAIASYVFAALASVSDSSRKNTITIGFIAAGLALWHFPQMWNELELAYG